MFTGIVTARGRVVERTSRGGDARMRFGWPEPMPGLLNTGDSVSVSGVCLTALDIDDDGFAADLSAETLSLTSLGNLRPGDGVNLEPALRASDRLGGHIVTGHVDGLGQLRDRRSGDGSEVFLFTAPDGLMRYLAKKGSVTVDGVSLTVNGVNASGFEVTLIPHTLEVTTLGGLRPGDPVNLEVDLLARYLDRLLAHRQGE